jgi:hypothetical protein
VSMMRSLFILVAICFSGIAFAQSASPKVGSKPVFRAKPKEQMGCKLVGAVRGTKLWAGDCVGPEPRGPTATTETQSLPEQATSLIVSKRGRFPRLTYLVHDITDVDGDFGEPA